MVLLLALLAASAAAQSVTLPGGAGTLSGGTCASLGQAAYAASNASYFYSIPYAQPPIGQLRFAPPQAYNGTLKSATTPAPVCPQFGQEFIELNQSEDCLYLDVWAPANAKPGDDLPVKVWIYGGGNFAGSISNPTYNGCNLAATGAVVVSINYRLGPLGFLGLSSFGIGGNFGTQDQLLGLSWVQSNIRAFGGNPSRVMIFGQSAGAVDTYTLGSLPQAPSLFQGGIAQSGGGRALPRATSANTFGALWAQTIGCSDIACLRSKTLSQLNITLSTVPNPNPGPSYNPDNVRSFGPFVDGKIIPANPADVGMRVPFIFGSTSREDSLLLLSQPGVTSPADITPVVYAAYLNSTFGPAATLVNNRYPVSAFSSAAFPAFEALVEVATQTTFLCPSYQGLLRANQVGTPAWTYLWSQAPTCPWYNSFNASVLPIFGAAHTAEIPFVFGNTYNNPPPVGDCNFTQAEDSLSTEFIGFWTGMASGTPGSSWPQFIATTSMGLNVLNGSSLATPGVVDYSVCGFWAQVNSTIFGNSSSSSNISSTATSSSGIASSATATSTRAMPASFTGAAFSVIDGTSFMMLGTAAIFGAYLAWI